MKMKSTLLGGTVLAGVALLSSAALAQAPAEAPAGQDATQVEEIVITGSRIRRTDLTASSPLQVIRAETIDEKGFTNVAEALNEQPISGVPISPEGDQAGFGVARSFVNIFNLGSNRTLTLVNGRRFVGSNVASLFSGAGAGGQVDTNAIPTALIDRIETIQATGGAIYGSDAVAGVINIITQTDFEGVEINGEYGVSEQDDAETYRGRITVGRNFLDGRANLSGSYEYAETSSLRFADRPRTALQLIRGNNPANTSGTDGIPSQIFYENRRIPEITEGGLPFRTAGFGLGGLLTIPDPNNPGQRVAAQFAPDGTLVPYNPGQFVQASIASGGDGLNLAELTSLQAPTERDVATLFGRIDLTNNIRLETEVFYNRTIGREDFNQPIYNSGLFGGASGALQFSTANPFLPASTRAAILAQPTPLPADPNNPGERLFFLHRASTDLVEPNSLTEGEVLRGVVNLAGDFSTFGRQFFWNVAFNQGTSEGFFQQDNIVQANFLQAINVTTVNGQIVCADAAARAAGCQPLNLFGEGARSQAALDYIGTTFRQDYEIKQTVWEANFGGDLIELPAGWAGFNVGVEYREEESSFQPNAASAGGIGRSAAIAPLSGGYDTTEWYAEVSVPVFGRDFSFLGMRSLDFDASYREVDNSQSGKDEAWSVGGRWRPVEDLLIRGSKSRSFRAPAITELFLPTSTSFLTATDPCDFRNIDSGPNPAARRANCEAAFVALGLPANFQLTSNIQAATQRGTTAGNPALVNEIAEQETYGFVYQPSFIDGLALNFDWVKIDLTNAIGNFTLTQILQVCYDLPTPDQAACSRFQRGAAGANVGGSSLEGQILGADLAPNGVGPQTGFINAGYTNFEGFTAGIEYAFDIAERFPGLLDGVSDLGRLSFDWDLFRVEDQTTSPTGLGFDQTNTANTIGNAKGRWNLNTAYTRGNLGILLTTRWVSESRFSNTSTIEQFQPQTIGDYYINDLSVAFDLADYVPVGAERLTARVQVRNLFDVEPPAYTTGIGVYDLIGRYYQVGLTARF